MKRIILGAFFCLWLAQLGAQSRYDFEVEARAGYSMSAFNTSNSDRPVPGFSFQTFNNERLNNARISGAPGYNYSFRGVRYNPKYPDRPDLLVSIEFGRHSYNVRGSLEPLSTTVTGDSLNARYTYRVFNAGMGLEKDFGRFSSVYGIQLALLIFDSVDHRVPASERLFGPEDSFSGGGAGMNLNYALRYRPVPGESRFYVQARFDLTLSSRNEDFNRGFYLTPSLGAGYKFARREAYGRD